MPDQASKIAPRRAARADIDSRSSSPASCPRGQLGLDYRATQDLLSASDGSRSSLGLARAPDHSTLWWHAHRRVNPDLVAVALAETVRRVEPGPGPRQIAPDLTRLRLSHTSWHFARRDGRDRGRRGCLRWALALRAGP